MQTSRTVVLAVVVLLGLITAILVGGALVLVAIDKDVPNQVWTLAGTGFGALSALLVTTHSTLASAEVLSPSPSPGPATEPVPVVQGEGAGA